MSAPSKPVLVVFGSDQGPGDASRSSLMSQTGALLAKKGARLICLAENDQMPLPVVTSARAAGGEVELIADESYVTPQAISDMNVVRIANRQARLDLLAERADCFVGLPGSLASATAMYFTIENLGAEKPIILLNHNNAFEIIRGISVDVFAHSFQKAYRSVQFAENVEDIWTKVLRMVG